MRKNQTCFMTEDAIENYGKKWRGVKLVVTSVSNKYMSAKEFFAKGQPEGYHPGYDEGVYPQKLYTLKRQDTDEDLPMSLYDWELE